MLESIAEYCTLKLINKNVIEEKKKGIFIYGFQLFFSTASSIITIIIIAASTGNLANGMIYLAVFMSLRITANGYHADTYFKCYLLTNFLFILYLLFLNFSLAANLDEKIYIILLFASAFYIWIKAPVEHPNHKLSVIKKKRNRLAARSIISGIIFIIALTYHFSCFNVTYAMSIAVYIVAFMMLVKNKEPVQ